LVPWRPPYHRKTHLVWSSLRHPGLRCSRHDNLADEKLPNWRFEPGASIGYCTALSVLIAVRTRLIERRSKTGGWLLVEDFAHSSRVGFRLTPVRTRQGKALGAKGHSPPCLPNHANLAGSTELGLGSALPKCWRAPNQGPIGRNVLKTAFTMERGRGAFAQLSPV